MLKDRDRVRVRVRFPSRRGKKPMLRSYSNGLFGYRKAHPLPFGLHFAPGQNAWDVHIAI